MILEVNTCVSKLLTNFKAASRAVTVAPRLGPCCGTSNQICCPLIPCAISPEASACGDSPSSFMPFAQQLHLDSGKLPLPQVQSERTTIVSNSAICGEVL
jgi:hypothetical protein